MPQSIPLIPVEEYSVHLENIILRLMIEHRASMSPVPLDPFMPLHDHVSSELFVCGQGELTLKTDSGLLTLYAGDAAVIPPHLPHTTWAVSPGSVCYAVSFLILPRNVRGCADLASAFRPITHGKQVLLFHRQRELFSGLEEILDSVGQKPPFVHAAQLAGLLYAALSQGYDVAAFPNTASPAAHRPGEVPRFMELNQIIERYYMHNYKMEDIARQLFISSRQLDRIVRQRYGKTLRQVFFDRRIQQSERLLLTTDMPISQIAASVGFGSAAIFAREFRQRRGISPTQFRRESEPPMS